MARCVVCVELLEPGHVCRPILNELESKVIGMALQNWDGWSKSPVDISPEILDETQTDLAERFGHPRYISRTIQRKIGT
jgi:hypothetical protein